MMYMNWEMAQLLQYTVSYDAEPEKALDDMGLTTGKLITEITPLLQC